MNIPRDQALHMAVLLAGYGQLVLVIASPLIPKMLKWREDTAKLRPLTRQIFWTYAVYIWLTNFWFCLLSILGAHLLLARTPLAAAMTAYVALYWIGRVLVQFFYFDRTDAPPGMMAKMAEAALVALFVFLSATYSLATAWNIGWL